MGNGGCCDPLELRKDICIECPEFNTCKEYKEDVKKTIKDAFEIEKSVDTTKKITTKRGDKGDSL